MKTKLKQLRDQRAEKSKELAKLMDATDRTQAGRKWDAATDQPVYDALTAEIKDIDASIARIEMVDELNSNPPTITPEQRRERTNDTKGAKDITAKYYDHYLRNGWTGLSTEEIVELRNAMSTTTPSEGGYTVQTEVSSDLIERLKAFGGMRAAATILGTSKGNPLTWPTTDGTSEEGEIVAQNASATSQDISFGTVQIGAYKYSSKIVTIPFELIQDSEVDVEGLVNRRIVERIARIENKHFTIGTGTNQPQGIVTGTTVGVTGPVGEATNTSYDSLVAMMFKVDRAYRDAAKWMMHDTTLEKLYKLVDAEGRPLFWAASQNLADPMPMTLLGRSIAVNNDMPVMAANAKSIGFGDHSKYIIRDVMAVSVFRFADSKYIEKGQIGYLAWFRADGKFTDIGDSYKLYQNSAT